jgi:hypothetical protein
MFALTRPHRHVLATLALAAFAVAPTASIAWTAWRVNRPAHVREVEAELSRQLGLSVSLEGVRYPRPGSVVYRGAVVRPDESGRAAETLRAGSVCLRRDGHELTLIVDGLSLHASSPRQAMVQVGTLLHRAGAGEFDRVSLAARTCEVDLGASIASYRLYDLAGVLQLAGGLPTVTASFRVQEEPGTPGPRCELTMTRQRKGNSLRTELAFKTADGQPVSAHVLDPYFTAGDWLGRSARIEGELHLSQVGSADWDAEFRGALLDLDLSALIHRLAPEHRLSGLAHATIASARWADQARGSGWVEIRGELLGGPGRIGADLLRALGNHLHFRLNGHAGPRRTGDWDFQAIGLAFTLDRSGAIQFDGALGSEFLPGAVLVQGQRTLPLASAPNRPATVAALVRTLVPGDDAKPDQLVPASFESQLIQRYLPAPRRHEGVRQAVHSGE